MVIYPFPHWWSSSVFTDVCYIGNAVIVNVLRYCILSCSALTESEFLGLCLFMKTAWLNMIQWPIPLSALWSLHFVHLSSSSQWWEEGALWDALIFLGASCFPSLERVSRVVTNAFSWTLLLLFCIDSQSLPSTCYRFVCLWMVLTIVDRLDPFPFCLAWRTYSLSLCLLFILFHFVQGCSILLGYLSQKSILRLLYY